MDLVEIYKGNGSGELAAGKGIGEKGAGEGEGEESNSTEGLTAGVLLLGLEVVVVVVVVFGVGVVVGVRILTGREEEMVALVVSASRALVGDKGWKDVPRKGQVVLELLVVVEISFSNTGGATGYAKVGKGEEAFPSP